MVTKRDKRISVLLSYAREHPEFTADGLKAALAQYCRVQWQLSQNTVSNYVQTVFDTLDWLQQKEKAQTSLHHYIEPEVQK